MSAVIDNALAARPYDQEHEGIDHAHVLDAEDIYVLCRLDEISVMLDSYCLQRRQVTMAAPRNARERHMREFGHALAFGCCRDRAMREAQATAEQQRHVPTLDQTGV